MDITIEMWTVLGLHCAECTCNWLYSATEQAVLQSAVITHKAAHQQAGDYVEVV